MNRLEKIQLEVKKLHEESNEGVAKWLYKSHVLIVANYAKQIAEKNKANSELCILGALFHDIARCWGVFDEPQLMNESLVKAKELMQENNYSEKEIQTVKEIILTHSCNEEMPETVEEKVLASADALAHFMTDFYLDLIFFKWIEPAEKMETFKPWVLKKIDRDFNKKIFFKEFKELARKRFEALQTLFSN